MYNKDNFPQMGKSMCGATPEKIKTLLKLNLLQFGQYVMSKTSNYVGSLPPTVNVDEIRNSSSLERTYATYFLFTHEGKIWSR